MTAWQERQGDLSSKCGGLARTLIRVEPTAYEWLVQADPRLRPLAFPTGGQAERFARLLAERISSRGEAAEVQVYDHRGALAGRVVVAPRGLPRSAHSRAPA